MAVFGKTEIGAEWRSLPIGYSIACRFLCLEDGQATEIVANVQGRYEQGLAKAKLYHDVGGQVGALLAESPEITLTQEGEHRFTISYPVVGGTYYWIAVHPSVAMLYWYDLGYAGQSSSSWGHIYPVNPDPWDSNYGPNYQDLEISFSVVYTPTIPLPIHVLNISSTPIDGIPFKLRGEIIGEMSLVTNWSGSLEEGIYEVEVPSNILVGTDIHNFVMWDDGSTNPLQTVDLLGAISMDVTYEPQLMIVTAFDIHAFSEGVEVVADGLIVETDQVFQTPATIEVVPGSYTIRLTHGTVTRQYLVDVNLDETIRVDGQLTPPSPSKGPLAIISIVLGAVVLSLVER